MHEMFTPLVSTDFSLFPDAAEAKKGSALANRIVLGLLGEERHPSFFSFDFFSCKYGSMTINWESCQEVLSG